MIEYSEGNLLEAQTEALVNTVNTEGVMGKGIALQFARKYPDMLAAYRLACKRGEVIPGRMHVFELQSLFGPRYVINFPTKRQWRLPSRMEDIESGLNALVDTIHQSNIRSIALPSLGCGNGGLDWRIVLPLIQSKLGALPNVRVIVYPPKGDATAGIGSSR